MSTFAIKILALVLMLLDHVGYYFPALPPIFRWVGRCSYPLFLFCMVWGYRFTRSRPKYLLRLYLMSLLMTALGLLVNHLLPSAEGYGNHNIFVNLLLVGLCISTIELLRSNWRRGLLLAGGFLALQLLYVQLPVIFPFTRGLSGDVLTGVVPSLLVNEYGLDFVLLGTAMYFLRERPRGLCIFYLLFCAANYVAEMAIFGETAQWMMVFALPVMLRFNGQKGPGCKALFYTFYPAHTILLYALSLTLGA